jgi:hypothetical protein
MEDATRFASSDAHVDQRHVANAMTAEQRISEKPLALMTRGTGDCVQACQRGEPFQLSLAARQGLAAIDLLKSDEVGICVGQHACDPIHVAAAVCSDATVNVPANHLERSIRTR